MPNKTIHIRDKDQQLWERAEQRAKTNRISLSALIAAAIVSHLGDTDTITVRVAEGTEAFIGRWLVAVDADSLEYSKSPDFGIAETGRGRIAIYLPRPALLLDFDTLDDAKADLEARGPASDPDMWAYAARQLELRHVAVRDI